MTLLSVVVVAALQLPWPAACSPAAFCAATSCWWGAGLASTIFEAKSAARPARTTRPRRARSGRANTGSWTTSTACVTRAPARPSSPSWSVSSGGAGCRPTTSAARRFCAAPELDDPRVYVAAQKALAELRAVMEADPRTRLEPRARAGRAARAARAARRGAHPERVQIADPGEIRARRFEAVFACGLQEGEWPAPRAAIRSCPTTIAARSPGRRARAAAARGPARPRALPLLRELLARGAAAVPRVAPRRRGRQPGGALVLRRGRQGPVRRALRSRACATSRRSHGARSEAPTEIEWERAAALAARVRRRRSPRGWPRRRWRRGSRERGGFSAGMLEAFTECPVRWLIDRVLDPACSSRTRSTWCAARSRTACSS